MTRLTPAARKSHSAPRSGAKQGSSLEQTFDALWRLYKPVGVPDPVAEHRPCPPRRWRIDRSWPALKLAVELEGGIWSGGRHTRGSGYLGDIEKYNALAVEGWLLRRLGWSD